MAAVAISRRDWRLELRKGFSFFNLNVLKKGGTVIHETKSCEIKSSDWPRFFQRLSEQRTGAMVTLETVESSGTKTEKAASAVLQGVAFEKTEGCSDSIIIRVRTTREIVHEILDPIRIVLRPSAESDNFNPLQIAAENGITIITFHPAIHPQMLGDLKAG